MSEYKEKIVNVATGEETWRDYTATEIAEVEAAQAESLKLSKEIEARENARKAVLEKLGLTDDEAKLLLS